MLLTACCVLCVHAAVNPLDVMEITPAEGNVTSLQSFTITFGDLTVEVNEDAIPTLTKGGGETLDGGMMADYEGRTVYIDFEERCTQSGQYLLNIPEGAITVEGQPLEPLSFHYTIQGGSDSFYDQIRISPAEGEVESLQSFTITFPAYVGEVEYGSKATLTNTTTGATYQAEMIDVGYNVLINFPDEVTEPGAYTLDIPGGAIVVYTLDGEMLPLRFNYTIKDKENSFYDQITINPAEGEVESLQSFTITFPAYVGEIEYGSKATLTNTTTGTAYRAEMIDVGYNVLINFPEEVTAPGEYTLTIPAGAVVIYTLGEPVQELNFHYTIQGGEPSFYDQITINPAEGEVESLQSFAITFPAYVGEIEYGSKAALTNTTTGTAYQAEMIDVGYNVLVYFPEEVTAPGEYTLTIPAGAVVIYTLGEQVQELNFHYTITAPSPAYTINPAEGEVYLLQNFTISYGSMVWVDEDVHPLLVNDETGATCECSMFEVGGNALIYMIDPLSELGNYTLTVPAGCIEVMSTGMLNDELVFHYTIVEKESFVPTVIEDQPDGELVVYQRTGGVIREVEKDDVADDEWPYEILKEAQDGSVNIVFADDNKVYIQRPVSWSYYNGWVEGTLSDDGKTITVPMGQYVAYTFSMEMAVQVAVFTLDENSGTYVYDPSVTELIYTINDDGSISMNGTDETRILGTMNRAFGEQFQYLDYEWLQAGDYESVYIPATEQPLTPPDGLETETYYLTTANFDGIEWEPYKAMVQMGFDGEQVWLQGISKYLPDAWIHGTRDGSTLTFPNTQLLGSYEALLYFKCAEMDPFTGATTQKDMVMTFDGVDTYTTFDYIFVTTSKEGLDYINYYQGMTLSKHPDVVVEVPEGLQTEEYYFNYVTYDANGREIENQTIVNVGFDGNDIYIQGLWGYLPDAWVKATIIDGNVVFDAPQYLGDYEEEYGFTYPIYLIAFDEWTGAILPQVVFDLDNETGAFYNSSAPFGIGINKTGYLNLEDWYNVEFIPVNPHPVTNVIEALDDASQPVEYYDLQGRRIHDITTANGIIIMKNADGSATKVIRR